MSDFGSIVVSKLVGSINATSSSENVTVYIDELTAGTKSLISSGVNASIDVNPKVSRCSVLFLILFFF